ncbi:asparagine--tRNA ligase [Candidatus Aenigmatarchaeota archaeon]
MKINEINDKLTGKDVSVRGWVYRQRASKNLVFIILRDSTGIIQCTAKEGSPHFEEAKDIFIESSLNITGKLKKDDRAPGGYEIDIKNMSVSHKADVFPITKDQSTEFLLDKRHLWLRSRKQTMIFKVKAAALSAAREWLDGKGFIETTPPIIVSGQTEGGSTLFEFDYFDSKAYLSQSAQLYQEALIFGLEKVYAITPSFRAEKSRTTRHLTEYWHLEPEAAWVEHRENMEIQEQMVSHICQSVAKRMKTELEFLGRDPKDLKKIKPPFKIMSYEEAIHFLQDNGFDIEWGKDLGAKEEVFLTEKEKKPMFIEKYPIEAKAFYMKENPEDPRTFLCNDLLGPEGFGEIIGGSERETDFDKLVERLKKGNEDLKSYEWYLDLRKFGSVPHSGFGMGIERLVKWLCNLEHIRDTQPFPRVINRSYP